jgi:DNA polymerase I-like protein with 3'-5' exonuclease and polymerase domains
MNLVFDIETDGLDPHKIFCISTIDVDTQEQKNFDVSNVCNGLAYLMQADKLIGHNIIGFDIPAIKKLYRVDLSDKKIVDTLVLSRLFNPVRASHSLEAWGYKLGFQKIDFDKYDKYSEEMMEYCANDVQLNLKVYEALKRESKGFTSESVNLERDTYKVITKQREHGFMLDVTLAMQLLEEFEKEIKLTEKEVHKTFKPRIDRRVIYPQHTKDGVLRKMGLDTKGKQTRLTDDEYDIFDKGQSDTVVRESEEPFKLGSRQQIGEYLQQFGWKPKEFTPTGQPKVDEKILNKVKDIPEATLIAKYLMLQKRIAQVSSWLTFLPENLIANSEGCAELAARVHGSVITNGTITGRMSHRDPNMAQIPSLASPYGKECRSCWTVADKFKLVGIDASGLELRMLAHYLNDEEFTDDIINGDIHTANQKRAGLKSRNQAKTFIYAFLYGAGDAKIGSVIGGNKAEGKRVKQSFLANFGTLKTFRNRITREAEQNGFIKGLDGRKIFIRSAHAALNSLLQGAGAIVMKRALVIFDELIKENNLLANCVANVHDEWQVEVLEEEAEQLGQLGVDAIRAAGVYYNLNCPLDGEYKIGGNWSETH